MRHLITSVLIFCLSGCALLSKENHLTLEHRNAKIEDSFCGFWSAEIELFGTGNLAIINNDKINVAFCAVSYYSKQVAAGFIFPIIPLPGRAYKNKRWVQIKNISSMKNIEINEQFTKAGEDLASIITFCKERSYTSNTDCTPITEFEKSIITLKPGEYVWVSIPEKEAYTITIFSDTVPFHFIFIEAQAYSWWALTV